jgi:serine/threonine-protein kinase
VLEQTRTREPDRLSGIGTGIDRDLDTVCRKCLEKDPTRRYRSAEALADDLERWMDHRPIEARSLGGAARAWRWCRRNPAAAALVTLAAASIAIEVTILGVSN